MSLSDRWFVVFLLPYFYRVSNLRWLNHLIRSYEHARKIIYLFLFVHKLREVRVGVVLVVGVLRGGMYGHPVYILVKCIYSRAVSLLKGGVGHRKRIPCLVSRHIAVQAEPLEFPKHLRLF